VLANDSDIDTGDHITASKVTDPTQGSLTLKADGSFIYTPNTGFYGTDASAYQAKDSWGVLSNVSTVTITVNQGVPSCPTTVNIVTNENTPSTPLSFQDLLTRANCTDAEGDQLTIVSDPIQGAHNGIAEISEQYQTVVYVPAQGASGSDHFVLRVDDGQGAFTGLDVNVSVNPTS
jgi:large repetitive protein